MINYIKQNFTLLLIIVALAGIISGGIIYFNYTTRQIKLHSEELVEYNRQMGELFVAFQERIISQNTINQRRDVFMVYSMDLVIKHYVSHNSPYTQMKSDDIVTFLDEIYTNSIVYDISPFLPLAFACVETDFYYDALGGDGERSVFQFMDSTVREVYRKLNLPFLDNWWQDPKEAVRAWFAYYHELSNKFLSEDLERQVRWTALAYNTGLGRNRMIPSFNNGYSIERYIIDYGLYGTKGNKDYNKEIWETFVRYDDGFKLK